jgi:molecular chaperone GrpE
LNEDLRWQVRDDRPEAAEDAAPEPAVTDQPDELTDDVAAQLEAVTKQRDEYLDALQRLKAEFDNYRKRVARDQELSVARASERLVVQLLPMLDDLERAVQAAVEHGELKLEDGVRLVHRALADMLQREGLVEVETEGLFDPHTQEALLSQPADVPEGTVIQVLQPGYKLGDRVLRPARVIVSSGLPEPAEG